MNLYEDLKNLFGPGKVFELKEGDKGSDDLKDYMPIIYNIREKYPTIPDDRLYDIIIDSILFYNSYSKKTTKRSNLLTLFKMAVTQGAINYISVKRNKLNDSAISYEQLLEEGIQIEGWAPNT